MRVAVVVTARPSYARIKTALEHIDARDDLSLEVVAAGSAVLERYGCVADVMEADGFPPIRVYSGLEGGTPEAMVKNTGLLAVELGGLFARERPDAVVTIADRHETLATAIAASYQNIPLVHVQGGEVTGSIDDRVRNAVTQLADHHLVATVGAANVVDQLTRGGGRCHIKGCPSVDLAARAEPLERLEVGVGAEIDLAEPFVLVLQHPVTTEYDEARTQVRRTIAAVDDCGFPAVWLWPGADAGTEAISKALRVWRESSPPVRFVRNLEPEAFYGLAMRAACIVGNSSFGIREASYLGLPAVNIGTRQDHRERAHNVVDVPHDTASIAEAIRRLAGNRYRPSYLYGDGRAGERIAQYLAKRVLRRSAA